MAATFSGNGVMQFENVNLLRSYPFAENAVLTSTDGRTLPDGAIVDMRLVLPYSESVSAELASVHLSTGMVSACVRIVDSGRTVAALSATISAANFKPYTPFRMEKLAGAEDVGGIVTFGDVEMPFSPETYFFSSVKVHPGCIVAFTPPKLRSIVDLRSGDRVSGDVGVDFSGYVISKRDGRDISLTLDDDADRLASKCALELPLNGCGAEPVMSINGVKPDNEGRIVLWFH